MIHSLLTIKKRLLAISEQEDQAHGIWDHAVGNLAHGRLDTERREALVRSTYEATAIHGQAIEELMAIYSELEDLIDHAIKAKVN